MFREKETTSNRPADMFSRISIAAEGMEQSAEIPVNDGPISARHYQCIFLRELQVKPFAQAVKSAEGGPAKPGLQPTPPGAVPAPKARLDADNPPG